MPVSNLGKVIRYSDWGSSFSSVPPGRSHDRSFTLHRSGTALNSSSFLGRGTDTSQWPLTCWDCGFESRRRHGCLLWILCVVRPLRLAYPSPRGVLPSVYVTECDQAQQ